MDGNSVNASQARNGSEGTSSFLHDAQGILAQGTLLRPDFFFSVQRLRGFRQVVTQAFTCRKLN